MNNIDLMEHANQFSEAVSALITAQGMVAENKVREYNGMAPAYSEDPFQILIRESRLGYNDLIEKRRQFNQ